jgi:cyclopropane-fatty-acyl-phospholipid synthase
MATYSGKNTDRQRARALRLLQDVLGSPPAPHLAVRLWDKTIWKPNPDSPTRCTLVLQHPGALRRMFLPLTEMQLGEAYIYNDFDIEGEIETLLPLFERIREQRPGTWEKLRYGARLLSFPNVKQERPAGVAATLHGRIHSPDRDRQAIAYHYDRSNDFYALWLDSQMVYTCAYFASPDADLESAQKDKLDYICRKLRLQRGEHLLDSGCGWGGLVMHAAQHFGVQAYGVTTSAQQVQFAGAAIAKAGLEGRCRVDLRDYRDLGGQQKYDKIASIGINEHVGAAMLPQYFKYAWELLRPGGVLLNHAIGVHSALPEPDVLRAFIHRYVFPDCEPVSISTTLSAAESAGFEVRDVENLREHYTLTLLHWLRRLEAHADEARRVAGEITYRTWRLYLLGAVREFTGGVLNLYQALLVKSHRGRNDLPLRRADWYT